MFLEHGNECFQKKKKTLFRQNSLSDSDEPKDMRSWSLRRMLGEVLFILIVWHYFGLIVPEKLKVGCLSLRWTILKSGRYVERE